MGLPTNEWWWKKHGYLNKKLIEVRAMIRLLHAKCNSLKKIHNKIISDYGKDAMIKRQV